MTTPASNNRFKGVSFQPQATPATPATGDGRLFLDTADGLLKWIDDAGVVTEVIGGGGVTDHGALTGLSDDDHTQYVLRSILTTNGDLFTRAAGAVSRLGIGSTGDVLTVSGGAPTWAAPAGGGTSGPTILNTGSQYSGSTTSLVVTMSGAAASGNFLYAGIGSTGRTVNSITQTNVTWTQLKTFNANSQSVELWRGVVSGGSGGTTATIALTGSNVTAATIIEVGTNLGSSASAGTTYSQASGTVFTPTVTAYASTTAGRYLVWCASGNNTSYVMPFAPFATWINAGGQLAMAVGPSPGGSVSAPYGFVASSVQFVQFVTELS